MKTDSKFEQRLIDSDLHPMCDKRTFHKSKIKYVIEHEYTPDFTVITKGMAGDIRVEHYEAKGFFKCVPSKYVWIRKVLPPNEELIFIFQNGKTTMPGAKRRSNGTKMTVIEWAEKHKFQYIDCKGKV